jgi:hypothetical protein
MTIRPEIIADLHATGTTGLRLKTTSRFPTHRTMNMMAI